MSKQLISGPEIPKMEPVHEDDRRAIREAEIKLPDGSIRRVTHLAIKQASVLGNHYHPKPEYFTVVSGNPKIVTAHKDTPENVTVRNLPEGGHVTMQPGEAHAFEFKGPGHLISTMDGKYEQSDLIPLKLEIPDEKKDDRSEQTSPEQNSK